MWWYLTGSIWRLDLHDPSFILFVCMPYHSGIQEYFGRYIQCKQAFFPTYRRSEPQYKYARVCCFTFPAQNDTSLIYTIFSYMIFIWYLYFLIIFVISVYTSNYASTYTAHENSGFHTGCHMKNTSQFCNVLIGTTTQCTW